MIFFHIHVSITETITNTGKIAGIVFIDMSSLCFAGGHTMEWKEKTHKQIYALGKTNLLTICELHNGIQVRRALAGGEVCERWPSNNHH